MLKETYPVTAICQTLGLSRSAFYQRARVTDETELRAAVETVVAAHPTYGSRRIAAQLRREPVCQVVNRKRVQRRLRQMGLSSKRRRRPPRTTDSRHSYRRYPNRVKDLAIVRPDQVWVADITYVRLVRDEVYLAILMDVFTRGLRGWHLSRSLGQELPLTALNKALRCGHRRSITAIRVVSTPPTPTSAVCGLSMPKSVWPRRVRPPRMPTPNASFAPSRRKKSI
jgi:hypothetical protein